MILAQQGDNSVPSKRGPKGFPREQIAAEFKRSTLKSGEPWKVLRREEGAVIVGNAAVENQLPLEQAWNFSVFARDRIALSIGDRIRFTKNIKHRGHIFLNNELRIVVGMIKAKSYSTRARSFATVPIFTSTRE